MIKPNKTKTFEQFLDSEYFYIQNFVKIAGLYCYARKRLKGFDKSKVSKKDKYSFLVDIEKLIRSSIHFYESRRIKDLTILNKIDHSDTSNFRLLSTSIDPVNLSPDDITKLIESNKEKDREIENLKRITNKTIKDLSKFISPEKENENAVDIYLRLVKKLDFIPTYDLLEKASNKKISSSSWHRKFTEDISFLNILQREIEKLINRTSIYSKKMFYTEVYTKISGIYDELLIQEFNTRIINKNIFDKNTGKEISLLEYITDQLQYRDYANTKK